MDGLFSIVCACCSVQQPVKRVDVTLSSDSEDEQSLAAVAGGGDDKNICGASGKRQQTVSLVKTQ